MKKYNIEPDDGGELPDTATVVDLAAQVEADSTQTALDRIATGQDGTFELQVGASVVLPTSFNGGLFNGVYSFTLNYN